MDEERLMKVVMLEALEMEVKVEWVQNLEESLRMFEWNGMSSEALGSFSMGEMKKAWMEVAWREVRGVWRQEAQRHPKLDLIGRLMEKECEERGKLKELMCERVEGWQDMHDNDRVVVVIDRACGDEAVGRGVERL